MNKYITYSLVCAITGTMLLVYTTAIAQKKKKDKETAAKSDTLAKETPYQKLFKDKKAHTAKGLITLHQVNGKVYFEFPVKLLKKPMLIGSVTESVSHSDDGAAGEQAHDPLCVFFEEKDSTVYIRQLDFEQRPAANSGNIQKNLISPSLAAFKVLAISPDSSSLVFEPTSFFVSGRADMDPFMPIGGLSSRKSSFKSDRSVFAGINAYTDNVTISSYLSYDVTKTFFGFVTAEDRPTTVLMKRTICLLPENPMQPRLNDPRIGVFYTKYFNVDASKGIEPVYYANRWRLEPSDKAAFERGELVAPVQPIVFYIDDKFPESWLPFIRRGVEQWNSAFEKIGYKNVIVTKMYPKDDPSFDPDNIRFNCIKYAPTATQNAMGPSWVDPRTGEILSASVYVYHGIVDILRDWLFVQTSAADKRARQVNMPLELVGPALTYVLSHEIGHCLGFMHNMGASSSFPVDSLRSPSFTQKYGTTPSIMDYARFNFIAQPGDVEKGVSMTPPPLGVYDYYAVDWLYRYIPDAAKPEDERKILEALVTEKIKDPMFRYGKQQLSGNLDPNAQSEDLGDDQVKATQYAMNNLRYVMEHMNEWVKKDDPEYDFRRKMNFNIINIQFYWYWTHVLNNLGGIYQYEKYQGDPFPAYKVVSKAKQRESLIWLIQTLEEASWLNNEALEKDMDALNGNAAEFLQTILFPYLMRWVNNIGFSEAKGGEDSYTQQECVADVFNYMWKNALTGKTPTASRLNMQRSFVQQMINGSGVQKIQSGKAAAFQNEEVAAIAKMNYLVAEKGLIPIGCSHADLRTTASDNSFQLSGPVSGYEFMPRIAFQTEDISHVYYSWLVETRHILEKIIPQQSGQAKTQYEYMLLTVKKALAIKQ